jgi:hypothetical protein
MRYSMRGSMLFRAKCHMRCGASTYLQAPKPFTRQSGSGGCKLRCEKGRKQDRMGGCERDRGRSLQRFLRYRPQLPSRSSSRRRLQRPSRHRLHPPSCVGLEPMSVFRLQLSSPQRVTARCRGARASAACRTARTAAAVAVDVTARCAATRAYAERWRKDRSPPFRTSTCCCATRGHACDSANGACMQPCSMPHWWPCPQDRCCQVGGARTFRGRSAQARVAAQRAATLAIQPNVHVSNAVGNPSGGRARSTASVLSAAK